MIIVTGATGTIGSELIRLLAADGRRVRALSRNPPDRPSIAGIEWVRADLADREGLGDVLRDGTSLFLLTGNSDDMVRLQTNAIRAAAMGDMERVVKLSALGATDHSRSVIGLWHYNIECVLRESVSAWTILRPHHFMQNLLDPLVFDRTAGRIHSASWRRGDPIHRHPRHRGGGGGGPRRRQSRPREPGLHPNRSRGALVRGGHHRDRRGAGPPAHLRG